MTVTMRNSLTGILHAWVAAAAIVFASCAFAQQAAVGAVHPLAEASVAGRYPAGAIKSIEMADAALVEVDRERADIESRYAREEQACYPEFFATSCIKQAKERRRLALSPLRSIEIEARAFKRRARVEERDAALATKRERDEAGRLERARHEEDSRRAAVEGSEVTSAKSNPGDAGKVKTTIFPDRKAKHEARLKQIRAKEAAKAQKRAENVAAYQKKVEEAQARQKEVESKKAEKEEKQRLKEATQPKPQ